MRTLCVCYSCGWKTAYAIEPKVCPQFCSDCRVKEVRDQVQKELAELKK